MQKKILNCEKLIKLVLIENIMRIKSTNAPPHWFDLFKTEILMTNMGVGSTTYRKQTAAIFPGSTQNIRRITI